MKFKIKKIATITSALSTGAIAVGTCVLAGESLIADSENKLINQGFQSGTTNSNEFSKVAPLDTFGETPILSQKMGPIVSYGSEISGLDWYGRPVWTFDLLDNENAKYMPGELKKEGNNWVPYTNRAFINWALDTENNILWLLTNTYYKVPNNNNENRETVGPQNIIGIDSITGKVIDCFPLDVGGAPTGFDLFYSIQVQKNGDLLVYNNGQSKKWWQNIYIDVKTKKQTMLSDQNQNQTNLFNKVQRDLDEYKRDNGHEHYKQTQTKMLYTIPIEKNLNVAIFCDFTPNLENTEQNTHGSGDLLLKLVNDKFEEITINDNNSPWYKGIYIKNLMSFNEAQEIGDQNKGSNAFNKSFYKTLDGKIYYAAWDKFIVFSNKFKDGYGIDVKIHEFKNKEIQSYTMDVNGNVFIKFKNDSQIQKLLINGNEVNNLSIESSTYYNMDHSGNDIIQKYANNFIIFNVYGETGSLMMMNARNIIGGKNIREIGETIPEDKTNPQKFEDYNFGLAVGIIGNKDNPNIGDTVGLLNGTQNIQKSADFELSENAVANKLPSEITRGDLNLLNDSFFTRNSSKDDNGNLLYPAFEISKLDDENGQVEISVHVDKIPWFSNKLPNDSIPTKITKQYGYDSSTGTLKTLKKIKDKTSWKSDELLSYDFKNSTPTQITVDDINELDPFQVSFNSKTVLDSNGDVLYPKKVYSKTETNDATGQLTIKVDYSYSPLSEEVNKIQTYSTTHTYTIFSNASERKFQFAGSNVEAGSSSMSDINVNDVPQLKNLAEANILPSTFISKNLKTEDYLAFVDTNKSKGYPISKMKFEFEANDNDGSLVVKVSTTDATNKKTFEQKYVGLNKSTEYNFHFHDSDNKFDKSSRLPSSINDGDVINNFITYSGYNPTDFDIKLFPNNEQGSLTIQIELSDKYTDNLANIGDFENRIAQFTISGFMTTSEFNKQYSITLKNDDDISLTDIKKLTTKGLLDNLGFKTEQNKELSNNTRSVISNGKPYFNIFSLVENEFVAEHGSKIPKNWESLSNETITRIDQNGKSTSVKALEITPSINNEAGTLNLSIRIDKSKIPGAESDLYIVKSYSGFVRGNINATDDNLAFYSQELLFAANPELKGMNAQEMKEWLLTKDGSNNTINFKKLLLTYTGVYADLIQSGDYTLDIEVNDVYQIVTITITFDRDKVTNPESLTSYSVQYYM